VAAERRYLASTEGFSLESTRGFLEHVLLHDLPQFFVVHDGEVVGWCDIVPRAPEGMRHVGVLGMGLRKEYRGKGLGRMLLAKALDRSEEIGLYKVELEVFASNIPAVKLYEHAGFVVEGRRIDARNIDGYFDDIIMMGLMLPRKDSQAAAAPSARSLTGIPGPPAL